MNLFPKLKSPIFSNPDVMMQSAPATAKISDPQSPIFRRGVRSGRIPTAARGPSNGHAVSGWIVEGKAQVIKVKTLPQTVAQFRKYRAQVSVTGIRRSGEQLAAITKEIVEPVACDISVALIAALHRVHSSVPSMQS